MRSGRSLATAGLLALLVLMAGAVPAQATIFERGTFSFDESEREDLCGIEARVDSEGGGKFRTRTGKGELDQAFFGMSNFTFTDTFTNLATGAFFTIEGRLNSKDVKATR